MNIRLANISDLAKIKEMYVKIIDNMNKNDVEIWDDIYPCEFFKEDIDHNRLYILEEDCDIAAAFALCENNDGEGYVKWKEPDAKSIYIDRLGVSVDHLRKGMGSAALKSAIKLTKEKNAKYLRLFVVDINEPAINLYLKNNFIRAEGIYEEKIDDDFSLNEYGFEIEV